MRHEGRSVAAAFGVALALAVACGPDVEEKPKLIEHRVEPCTTECGSLLDPECGNVTHPRFPQFASVDACVESCAATDSVWHWGRQEDGGDACTAEWASYAECLAALSCEDSYRRWNDPLTGEYPCKAQSDALLNCGYANAPEGG